MSNDLSDNYKLALEVSIKFCGYRERSVKEVENKLIDKRFSRDVIRLALQKIKDLGFVDNLRFSKSFSRGKNKNPRKLLSTFATKLNKKRIHKMYPFKFSL